MFLPVRKREVRAILALAVLLVAVPAMPAVAMKSPTEQHARTSLRIHIDPASGPAGSAVLIRGAGYAAFEKVAIRFVDNAEVMQLGTARTDASGSFASTVSVPQDASPGTHDVKACGGSSSLKAVRPFVVT